MKVKGSSGLMTAEVAGPIRSNQTDNDAQHLAIPEEQRLSAGITPAGQERSARQRRDQCGESETRPSKTRREGLCRGND
jgi:hypothetical protein